MKKLIFLFAILIGFTISAFSQSGDSLITVKKKRFYYQDEKQLTKNQLRSVLLSNQASESEYRIARSKSVTGSIIMGTGAVAILAGAVINLAGTMQEANDVNNGELNESYPSGLGLIIVGAAIEIVSIPFLVSGNKHFKKAISNYNSAFGSADAHRIKLNMVCTKAGPGLRLNF